MKKLLAILIVFVLVVSLIPTAAFAGSTNSSVKFNRYTYKDGDLYIKSGGNYYVMPIDPIYFESEYFAKRASLSSEENLWKLDFKEIADGYGFEESVLPTDFPFLVSNKYIYATLYMYNKDDNEKQGTYIVRINKETGEFKPISDMLTDMVPRIVKRYNGETYFAIYSDQIKKIDKNGKVVDTGLNLGEPFESQSSSNSRYLYGTSGALGFNENLSIASLKTNKRIRTYKKVRGYYATDKRLYYGKTSKNTFKVYSATASGKDPKVICSIKQRKMNDNLMVAKVTPKYIYLKAISDDWTFANYYRYNRKTKKRSLISYEKYTANTQDYREGFEGPKG